MRRIRARGDGNVALSDSLEYDARGKIRTAVVTSAVMDVGSYTSRVWYTGHGAVLATEATKGGAWWEAEQFRVTALGQVFYSRADKGAVSSPYPQVSYFNERGALTAKRPLRPGLPSDPFYQDTVYAFTDTTGAVSRSGTLSYTSGAEVYTATRNYFGTDDRLVATQRYYSDDAAGRSGSWDEFRYDALGRRVLTRTRRVAGDSVYVLCSIDCVGVVERTVWDGDQVLYEFRADGGENRTAAQLDQLTSTGTHWGKAGYVQGPAIDQPIFLMGGRVPNYNWRGLVESSVRDDGTSDDCAIWPTAGCKNYGWPAGLSVYYRRFSWSASSPTPQWVGSMVRNGAGSTGVLYRRNRYYDPGSGQFTQPDPIGLAGGLNLFGYANGDPINFWDPFGLCASDQGNAVASDTTEKKLECTYTQSDGNLSCTDQRGDTVVNERAYSGRRGPHRNNPASQSLPFLGPIPQGTYQIFPATTSKGPWTLPLIPSAGNEMFGRNDFAIHGDSRDPARRGDASQGCIIASPSARERISNSRGSTLTVKP